MKNIPLNNKNSKYSKSPSFPSSSYTEIPTSVSKKLLSLESFLDCEQTYIPDFDKSHPHILTGGLHSTQSNNINDFSPPFSINSPIPLISPPTRKPSAIVDYLTFTFSLDALHSRRNILSTKQVSVHPDDILADEIADQENGVKQEPKVFLSIHDEAIGFLLTLADYIPYLNYFQRDNGLYGYKKSFTLYRDAQQGGLAAYDGNKGTMYISLTGKGCSGVDMVKLREFMSKLDGIKITRIDLAHDDLEGSIGIQDYINYYYNGFFTIKGLPPSIRSIDDHGSGKGKTVYVGNKANGKEACIYEKGKQLGDKLSDWVRVEIRFTSEKRVIPLDAMILCSEYIAGSYPVFERLSYFCERVDVIKKQAKISMDCLIDFAKVSYGKLIYILKETGNSSDQIVDMLIKEGIPKRLDIPMPPQECFTV